MIADIQLRGLSEITQDRYVRAVRQLAEHYGKSPDKIAEEELSRNDPYNALKTTLQAEIDRQAWESLHSALSRPFDLPGYRTNPANLREGAR
jgi:hypothetical protein